MPALPKFDATNRWLAVLFGASPGLAVSWWLVLLVRAAMPALFAIVTGNLIGAVYSGSSVRSALLFTGAVFLSQQVLGPVHHALGANLGTSTSSYLNRSLASLCLRPLGIGHLEDPSILRDFAIARDFDLGLGSPPLDTVMGFVASGLVELIGGLCAAALLFKFSWWAPLFLIGAWLSTHWLLNDSAVWAARHSPEVADVQRHAQYAYKMAMDPTSAGELRIFGLADWFVNRFAVFRRSLVDLQWKTIRLRRKPVIWSLLLVASANVVVLSALAADAESGRPLAWSIAFVSATIAANTLAFGGLSWALDVAFAPVTALSRLNASVRARETMLSGSRPVQSRSASEIRFRNVSFKYPGTKQYILKNFDLTIQAGTSIAIVGKNGAGKTTLAKLLCRLYDADEGVIEIDGTDLRELSIDAWRSQLSALFQDFIRFELPLRDNVAPSGASDDHILSSLSEAGVAQIADLGTILARGYAGGIEPSGGQWQRIALARVLCATQEGAGVVLFDEPTAQLDVRGEAEIFTSVLAATRGATTILISHRFPTVRLADRICVIDEGRVIELGSHDELIAAGGLYRKMFELQASRFDEKEQGGSAAPAN